jgi:hypothetical protein
LYQQFRLVGQLVHTESASVDVESANRPAPTAARENIIEVKLVSKQPDSRRNADERRLDADEVYESGLCNESYGAMPAEESMINKIRRAVGRAVGRANLPETGLA